MAEDNPTNQAVAVAMLKRLGYRVEAVANGGEAIKALSEIPYDLVLMDCQMPEIDGYEATRWIRSGDSGARNPDIPIIAMTAHAMTGDRERCLAAGMNDYLSKPVQPKGLEQTLARWLVSRLPADEGREGPVFTDPSLSPRPPGEGPGVRVFAGRPEATLTLEGTKAVFDEKNSSNASRATGPWGKP